MRKHFLILFLMALLPLAGWADAVPSFPDGSKITGLSTYTYTGGDQKATILAGLAVKNSAESEEYTDGAVIKIYTDAACKNEAATVTDAGTYYVGAYGDGTNYATTALVKKDFTVGKKEVTVTANATTVVFGEPITNNEFSVTYTGWVAGVSDGTATTLDSNVTGTVGFTSNYVAGTTAAGATGIVITPVVSGLSAKNYKFTPATGTVTVSKRTLKSAMIQAMAAATYNGTDQVPTLVVKDGDRILSATTDYTAAWTFLAANAAVGDTPSDVADITATDACTAAGTYTVTLTAAGSYKDDTEAASATYVIKRREIQLRTLGDNLTYSKQPYATGSGAYVLSYANHVEWQNVLDGDLVTTDGDNKNNLTSAVLNGATITLALYDGLTEAASAVTSGATLNAGTYRVKATVTNANSIPNYTINVGNLGKVVVAKKQVSITPKSLEAPYGTKDEFTTATAITANTTNLTSDPKVYGADNYLWIGTTVKDANGNITGVTAGTGLVSGDNYEDVFTPAAKQITIQRTDGNGAGSYPLTATIPANAEYTNYEFTIAEPGTYKIKAIGGVQIWAENVDSDYKTAQAALTATIVGVEDADITEAIQTAVNQSLYVDFEDDDVTTAKDAHAGSYTIKIDDEKLADALAPLTNYDLSNVGKYTGTYTVNRVALTVKAKDQVRMVGETVDAASDKTIAYVEDVTLSAADKNDIYGKLALAFTDVVTSGTYRDATTGVLLAAAIEHGNDGAATPTDTEDGVYVGAVEITAASVAAYNSGDYNYTLTIAAEGATGTLTACTNVTFELDAKLATNTAKLTPVAAKKLNVTIKNKKLNAGSWYTIALPFDITPFEFTQAIGGYAIFDRLATTGDKLSFKISMDAIPAYTPFLVKVDNDVQLGDVIFDKVTIAAPEVKEEANNTWKIVSTIDAGRVENLVYWLNRADGINLGMNDAGSDFRGFDAYITTISGQPASEARIYIEEADGSTTAISAITADGQLVSAEGWYTLNGVKLQGVPTEKGVYINNGKKIVIK